MQYSTIQCSTTQYNTVQYNRYSAMQYSAIQYTATQYSAIQYTATQCSAIQYSIACSTYSRIQYCTKLKKNIDQKIKSLRLKKLAPKWEEIILWIAPLQLD